MQKYLFFILVFFLWGSSVSLWAYPVYPRTLSDVYKEADHVVYGKVVGFIPQKEDADVTKPPKMYDTMVHFLVQEEIKGELKETEICIAHFEGMMCPEPFDFKEGQEVLLFLNKDWRESFYWTYAMSYGGREVTTDEYSLYKKKLLDLQAILDQSNQEIQEQQYIDWIVNCIKEPLTRWDGIFDLLNEKEGENKELVDNPYVLTQKQKEVLCQDLYQQQELRVMDFKLIPHIRGTQDSVLLQFVLDKMKKLSNTASTDDLFLDAASVIADLSSRTDLKKISNQIEEEKLSKKGRALIRQFRQIM